MSERMNKKQIREKEQCNQGFKLSRVFVNATLKGSTLYAAIHKLEREAHRLAERYCNEQLPEGYLERKEASIKARLALILGAHDVPVFINLDPRGYALKVDDAYMRANNVDLPRDWGGYGLLAPDFE